MLKLKGGPRDGATVDVRVVGRMYIFVAFTCRGDWVEYHYEFKRLPFAFFVRANNRGDANALSDLYSALAICDMSPPDLEEWTRQVEALAKDAEKRFDNATGKYKDTGLYGWFNR